MGSNWACNSNPALMKISLILIPTIICTGCVTSHRQTLTSQQATTIALQLANQKASETYQCMPFHDGQPAHLADGHWIWTGHSGYGKEDLEATVLLAVNGTMPNVELQLLDNKMGFPGSGTGFSGGARSGP
jgi:hypothetical protein